MLPPPYPFRDPARPSPVEQWAKLEGKSPTMTADLLRAAKLAFRPRRSGLLKKLAVLLRFLGLTSARRDNRPEIRRTDSKGLGRLAQWPRA